MKHERGIKAAPVRWRLRKTLARRVHYRPIEDEDVRYAWAAYKQGALKDMAGPFAEANLTADEFKAKFAEVVTSRYHAAWTMFAETRRGYLPAGIIFGFWSHQDLSPFMIVGDLAWMPWASARNRVECAVNFFNTIKSTIPMVDYAHGDTNKRFFEMLCQHGVMRRVGTTFNVVKGEPVAVFETRVG